MTELSPAARLVFESFNSKFEWVEDGVPGTQFKAIAAALRAAVRYCQSEYWSEGEQRLAKRMLMISDELEAQ